MAVLPIKFLKFVYVHRPDRFNNLAVWANLDNLDATPPANSFFAGNLQERPSLNKKAVESFAPLDARLVEVTQKPEFVGGLSLIFFNHHAISLSQGVGHPPSHRLKSFPLTFFRGGLPPRDFCQGKRGVFFGMFSTFLCSPHRPFIWLYPRVVARKL